MCGCGHFDIAIIHSLKKRYLQSTTFIVLLYTYVYNFLSYFKIFSLFDLKLVIPGFAGKMW